MKKVILIISVISLILFVTNFEKLESDNEPLIFNATVEEINSFTQNKTLNFADGFFNSEVKEISAGTYHSLILTIDGIVYSFGGNEYGELGNGNSAGFAEIPIKVANTDGCTPSVDCEVDDFINDGRVAKISAGTNASLILTTDGVVYSFGYNDGGRLGHSPTESEATTPKKVENGTNGFKNGEVSAISAGSKHNLFLTNDGIVYGTGRNNAGQLGDGGGSDQNYTPIKVENTDGCTVDVDCAVDYFINDGRVKAIGT